MKLSIPIERFTSPPEDSLPLLRLYFRSLVTGSLKLSWCPVLYVVALSHVNSFIFSQDAAAQVPHSLHYLWFQLKENARKEEEFLSVYFLNVLGFRVFPLFDVFLN